MDENNDKKLENDSNFNNNVYIPQQLEDDEFEKEKEELKKQKEIEKNIKKQKRKLNKEKKQDKIEYDEEGNIILKPVKNKKKIIITIIICILLVAIIIGGVVGYIIMHLSKPENIINDFTTYFNSQNWDEMIETIDFKSYYTLNFYLAESKDIAYSRGMEYHGDFTQYDSAYNSIDNDEAYLAYKENINSLLTQKDFIFDEYFSDININIDEILKVEKVENTKNLYRISVKITVSAASQSSSESATIYVAKVDNEYKIVAGDFPDLIHGIFGFILSNYQNSITEEQLNE